MRITILKNNIKQEEFWSEEWEMCADIIWPEPCVLCILAARGHDIDCGLVTGSTTLRYATEDLTLLLASTVTLKIFNFKSELKLDMKVA